MARREGTTARGSYPTGRERPASFDSFLSLQLTELEFVWRDLQEYELKDSANEDGYPFLLLGDGAMVALWFASKSPSVVLIDAHGEHRVVSANFDEFVHAWNHRVTGVGDIDERDEEARLPGYVVEPSSTDLGPLQQQFVEWLKAHSALLEPLSSVEGEALRSKAMEVARQMLRDGLSRVYTLDKPWWSLEFKIKRYRSGVELSFLDYGQWYPLPSMYEMESLAVDLLKFVQNPDKVEFDLSICSAGIVSVDRDRELVLEGVE